jgi:DNA-binding NarL/FixJ family response regulator
MQLIRVLLADDHALFRAGIRAILKSVPEIEIIGEAATGREALDLIAANPPNVVLMDILMPQLNGLDAAAQIVAMHPAVRVIILSMNSAEEYVLEAIRAGAAGYLLKNVDPTELELAIRTVAQGEPFLSSTLSRQVMHGLLARVGEHGLSEARLTLRQREVLQLVVEGYRTKEIAKKLGVSIKTVEMHRAQTMQSLDIHDIPGLVRYAIRAGLISANV